MIKINSTKIKFLFDLFVNTFSFGIYIISQQLIFMPIMGKLLDANSFATFIMFISIFSIISNTLGSELGIVRQIFEDKENYNKYNIILLYLLFFVFVISFGSIYLLKYSIYTTIILSIVIVLANLRLYSSASFRMNKKFEYVLVQNILYLVGLVIGLLFFHKYKLIWAPPLIAELLSVIFSFYKSDLKFILKSDFHDKIDKKIIRAFKDYSLIELLINMVTYFDKILIYPILGVNSVNIYYATSTMSKITSLITNPLHGVLLSWLKGDDQKNRNYIIKLCFKYCLPIIIIVSLFTILLTYLAVKFLYNQYLSQSLIIIVPISISVGISFVSSIIKTFLLKYINSSNLLNTYIIYLVFFILLSILLSLQFNLLGFTIAGLISKILLLILFFYLLIKIKEDG